MGRENLWIVVDASGSMNECGRKMLVRQLCRYVEQFIRFGYGNATVHLLSATEEIRELEWDVDDEFPLEKLQNLGTFDPTEMCKFLEEKSGQVLIITDGFLAAKCERILSDWASSREDDSVRLVVTSHAKKFTSRFIKSFSSQDLFLALDRWIGQNGDKATSADSEVDEW